MYALMILVLREGHKRSLFFSTTCALQQIFQPKGQTSQSGAKILTGYPSKS